MRARTVALLSCTVLTAVSSLGVSAARAPVAAPNIEPGVVDLTAPAPVIARFAERIPDDLATIDGLDIGIRFEALPIVAATATPAAIRALAARDDLAYLEYDKPIEFDLDSAAIASGARAVEAEGAYDGTGVGIAIVDSGLDGLHPDYQVPGKVGGNWQITPLDDVTPVQEDAVATPWNSYLSGHGTHVAGIAAGSGEVSEGLYRGAAPGATLYAFDMYVGTQSLAARAFDWILAHGAEQDPPIRIVNNSWHCSASSCAEAFNPDQAHVAAATALAEAGIVVTWAAGNHDTDGDNDGWASDTNAEAHNQTPGIIGVANYNDHLSEAETGVRNGCIARGSSRGSSADATTWPDLAAPGSSVMSTWAISPAVDVEDREVESRNPVDGTNTYRSLTGTSMSAPHVAGIVALMLQADPELTPAEVEYLLKATADKLHHCTYAASGGPGTEIPTSYVRADTSHPWDGSNHIDGHGLVDAVAAVEAAENFSGIPSPVEPEAIPASFIRARAGIVADHTFYLKGDAQLEPGYPDAAVPRATLMPPGQLMTFTSAPLTEAITTDGLKVGAYLGTTTEVVAVFNPPRLRVRVERVPTAGEAELVAAQDYRMWQIGPLGPTYRDLAFPLDEPIVFGAGDRVRLTIGLISPPLEGLPHPTGFWALYWESMTSSRVVLGHVVDRPTPETRAWCESRQDCADLDETHVLETMTCGRVPVRLTWTGPPGSALIYECLGASAVCAIPPSEEATGHCETELEFPHALTYKGGRCTYRLPDGSRGGSGRCVGLELLEDDD